MCPLRIILIFLSATLAGFFVIRNLKSEPCAAAATDDSADTSKPSASRLFKVRSVVESGFWTCVDMASGRYLWRHLVASNSKPSD